MGMRHISLKNFDEIKNVAKHPAHTKHSTTFLLHYIFSTTQIGIFPMVDGVMDSEEINVSSGCRSIGGSFFET